jgi:hypothetical protein
MVINLARKIVCNVTNTLLFNYILFPCLIQSMILNIFTSFISLCEQIFLISNFVEEFYRNVCVCVCLHVYGFENLTICLLVMQSKLCNNL